MPKAPEEVTVKAWSVDTPGVSYLKTGMVVEETQNCLALVEHEGGFILYHILSGGAIGSNLDNIFETFEEASTFAQKFWAGVEKSNLALKMYRTKKDLLTLRLATPLGAAAMAKRRTKRAEGK